MPILSTSSRQLACGLLAAWSAAGVFFLPSESQAEELWAPHWSTRLSFAMGVPTPSAHESVLHADTYSEPVGARFAAALEVSHTLNQRFALGLRAEYGFRDARSDNPHPNLDQPAPGYSEQFADVALRLPITLLSGKRVVILGTPFAGWGGGTAYFYRAGRLQSALLLGLELGAYFPRAHLGFGGGIDTLRVGKQSAVDGPNDFGMIYFNVVAGFDVKG
jgi:hypothetical protein